MPQDDDLIDAKPATSVETYPREDTVAMTSMTTPSNLPKNARFQNTPTHDYNLRSHQPNFTSQCLYDCSRQVNHIFTPCSKHEMVDSLINGTNKEVWIKILSNEWGRLA